MLKPEGNKEKFRVARDSGRNYQLLAVRRSKMLLKEWTEKKKTSFRGPWGRAWDDRTLFRGMSLAHSLNFSAWQASALTLSALQFAGVFVLYAPALFWRRKIYFKFFLSWCFIEIRAITQIAMKQSLSTKFRDLFLFWVSHGVYNHFLNPPPPLSHFPRW